MICTFRGLSRSGCRLTQHLRFHRNTICALSSGKGKCAIGVLRVSGPAASEVMTRLTGGRPASEPRSAALRKIVHPVDGSFLDEAIVLWFPAPRSVTGEDLCEFHVHGGRAVIEGVLQAMLSIDGCQMAEPGEFTKRAYANGKLDLLQVEGLADLIEAETKAQREQAARALTGSASKFYRRITEDILECSAGLEAYINFSEENTFDESSALSSIAGRARILHQSVEEVLQSAKRSRRIRDGVKIAILGAPNAGKSSLLNQLARDDVSIVSSIPGTTRDVVVRTLDVGGYPVVVQDTAGLRDTSEAGEIEREGMKRSLKIAEECDIAVIVVDATKLEIDSHQNPSRALERLSDVVEQSIESCMGSRLRKGNGEGPVRLFVLNKEDLLDDNRRQLLRAMADEESDVVIGSCLTSTSFGGIYSFLAQSLALVCDQNPSVLAGATVVRERHRKQLESCAEYLEGFLRCVDRAEFGDVDAASAGQFLRSAAKSVASLTGGGFTTEDVLGKVFSEFCVGK